jgi:hypothetical protein
MWKDEVGSKSGVVFINFMQALLGTGLTNIRGQKFWAREARALEWMARGTTGVL